MSALYFHEDPVCCFLSGLLFVQASWVVLLDTTCPWGAFSSRRDKQHLLLRGAEVVRPLLERCKGANSRCV